MVKVEIIMIDSIINGVIEGDYLRVMQIFYEVVQRYITYWLVTELRRYDCIVLFSVFIDWEVVNLVVNSIFMVVSVLIHIFYWVASILGNLIYYSIWIVDIVRMVYETIIEEILRIKVVMVLVY